MQAAQPYNLYSSEMLINLTEKIKMIHSVNMSNVKKAYRFTTGFYFLSFYITAQPVNKVKAWLSQSSASRSSFHNLLNEHSISRNRRTTLLNRRTVRGYIDGLTCNITINDITLRPPGTMLCLPRDHRDRRHQGYNNYFPRLLHQ